MIVKEAIKILQQMDENLQVKGQINTRVPGTTSYTGQTARTIEIDYKWGDCIISLSNR